MNSILKRILCLLLSAVVLCSLVACGVDEPTPSTPDGATTGVPGTTESTGNTTGTTGATQPGDDTTEPGNDTTEPSVDGEELSFQPAVYLTTPGDYVKFVRQGNDVYKVYSVQQLNESEGIVVKVDTKTAHQTIEGWGASFTESACVNMWKMPEATRNAVMTALFDPNKGIGMNILRQPLGISDFSVDSNRDYVDDNDESLESFSIAYDEENIIPLIKQAMEIANCDEDFKVFFCSWTAPLWMKTIPEFHSSNKSTLKREYYSLFADYLVKAIQAYEAAGVPIYTITAQNEPTGVHGIAAMYMPTDNLATFYQMYLVPALEEAGLDTKILAWDFNYFSDSTSLLSKINDICGGVAYHAYSGKAASDIITNNKNLYPNLPIYITEAAGMRQSASARFFRQMDWIMDTQRRGSSAHILWNIVLDENTGPALIDDQGNSVNTIGVGMLEWNIAEQKVSYLEDFYALAHFSKFVRPGAVRMESTDLYQIDDALQNVVYRNENGTYTAVLMNNDALEHAFKIVVDDYVIEYTVPGKSGATITWNPNV